MHTLKKFVKYYAPYRTVFFLDLICAAIISLVDLAFPQILRSLTKTLFTEDPSQILEALLPIGLALLVPVPSALVFQPLNRYPVRLNVFAFRVADLS